MLKRWNFLKTGFYEGINVGDRDGVFPAVNAPTAAQLAGEGCWLADVWSADDSGAVVESSNDATGEDAFVGSTMVPAGLRNDNLLYGTVRSNSGRDSENNVQAEIVIAFYQKGARAGPRPLTPPAKPGTILSTTTAPKPDRPGSLQKGCRAAFQPSW